MDPILIHVMEATGYLIDGKPAATTVGLADAGTRMPWGLRRTQNVRFTPDAWWRGNPDSAWGGNVELKAFFKFVEDPETAPVADWQQEVWNRGFAPFLWVVSPDRVELFNGFGLPRADTDDRSNVIEEFSIEDVELEKLDQLAGRLAMETGRVWEQFPDVDRSTGVDQRLLRQLGALERRLTAPGLNHKTAQALIGRAIFVQYLVDGKLIKQSELERIAGQRTLHEVFEDRDSTKLLFTWLREKFNGDMFQSAKIPRSEYLCEIARFLSGTDPETGERSLFPYRFDVIPIELISAVYEQFIHSPPRSTDTKELRISAKKQGVFYTPLTAVSLILDETFDGLTGDEHILDLTCGSGVFLVESLRRLVLIKSNGKPERQIIRQILYEQIHGVDISAEAIQIASFSLYLAALEMDPNSSLEDDTKFRPLVGNTLRTGDAFQVELSRPHFDVIVGNPPWTYRGEESKDERYDSADIKPVQPRGESLDFVQLALRYARKGTRIGMVLSATLFFNKSSKSKKAVQSIVTSLDRVSLVDLSELTGWLFPKARMPAMVLLGRTRGDSRVDNPMDEIVFVHARWTPSGQQTNLIELSPNEITELPLSSWRRNDSLFKAAFLGCRHDLLLLDEVAEKFKNLRSRLNGLGKEFKVGLILGDRSKDASFLSGMSFVKRGITHFNISSNLSVFSERGALRPRQKDIYTGPVLLVGEFLQGRSSRVVTVMSSHDVVYSSVYFSVAFKDSEEDVGYLLAGLLASSFVSWFLLMTASDYGIWIRRIKQADLLEIPMPDLMAVAGTKKGRQIVNLVRTFHHLPPSEEA